MAWFEDYLQSRGVKADPPPKKKSALLSPLTELSERMGNSSFFKKAGEDVRAMAQEAVHNPKTFLMGMVGTGELGAHPAPRKVGSAALRFHVPGEAEPRLYTGQSHPTARLQAEDELGDLLDDNFEPRFKEESGFLDNQGLWLSREDALALAKKNKQLGGNVRAQEGMKRSGQLKSEGLLRDDPYANAFADSLAVSGGRATGDILAQLTQHGGATLTPHGAPFTGSGFAVADPAFTLKTSAPEEMQAFLQRPDVTEALAGGKHIGKWTDPETGEVEINLSDIIGDRSEALQLGAKRGEKAVGHLKGGEYQGDVTVPPEHVVAAVTKYNGKDYDARTHGQTFDQIKEERNRLGLPESRSLMSLVDDNYFRTSTGRVINRKEALELARATKSTGEQGSRGVSELMRMPGDENLKPGTWEQKPPVARSNEGLLSSPAEDAPAGFGLFGHVPEQKQLEYFRGPRTDPGALDEAYERSLKAFRHTGPYKKFLKAGSEYPGSKMWYDTRGIYKDAADEIGPEAAASRVNDLLGLYMPSSTARSSPPNNLKRAFMWQQARAQGAVTPEMLRAGPVVAPEGFGHFAQTSAHQPALARAMETGSVDPVINPKPASFGENETGNWEPGTFDTVMSNLAKILDPDLTKFFAVNKVTGDLSPRSWAYGPLERGLADAAKKAQKAGLLEIPDGLAPTAPYQSIGWHGKTKSAEYGSMYDIWAKMRDDSAKLWGVSPAEANRMIWKDGRVPLMPLDTPLRVTPRSK